MIKLKYVGNKPIITPNGIDFKVAKQDKYEFIEPSAHLLEVLQKEDLSKKELSIRPKRIYSLQTILDILKKSKGNLEEFVEEKISQYKQWLDDEIREVDSYKTLTDVEKVTLKNNFKLMKDYRIQRAINKIIYEEFINISIEMIYKNKIKSIEMPFSMTFLHIANSIKTTLEKEHKNISVDLQTKLDRKDAYAKVCIKY